MLVWTCKTMGTLLISNNKQIEEENNTLLNIL